MNTVINGAFYVALAITTMLVTLAYPKLKKNQLKFGNENKVRSAYN